MNVWFIRYCGLRLPDVKGDRRDRTEQSERSAASRCATL
jgi:hypothetical protein